MDIDEEKLIVLKQQIISNIESNFPEERKKYAIEKIKEMTQEEFIDFLRSNDLIKTTPEEELNSNKSLAKKPQITPFRLIVENKIPSYIIEESSYALAVLEINPVSIGHTLIIPKKAISDPKKITKNINAFAEKISKKINSILSPKNVIINTSKILNEIIIDIIPIYNNETIDSPRKKISENELAELKKTLQSPLPETKNKEKNKILKEKKSSENIIIPRRIP